MERFRMGSHREADPELLRQAFLWSERRRVSRTATVSFHRKQYQVDPLWSASGRASLPTEDLSQIEVKFGDRQLGLAVPLIVERHVDPQVLAFCLEISDSGDSLTLQNICPSKPRQAAPVFMI
jgi:hypothetical protein